MIKKVKRKISKILDKKSTSKYYESNKLAWDTVSPLHKNAQHEKWLDKVVDKKFSCLNEAQIAALKQLKLKNKNVFQPGCNNGVELISIKKLGAKYCLGIDISKEFIEQAKQLAKAAELKNCEFNNQNFADLKLNNLKKFDIAFVSVGTLPWMLDLDVFFQKTNKLLKRGGHILINEMNPLLHCFDYSSTINKIKVNRSYFDEEIDQNNISLDYYSHKKYKVPNQYCRYHQMSEIVNALIKNKFEIVSLEEHQKDFSLSFQKLEKSKKLPLSYTLIARKKY